MPCVCVFRACAALVSTRSPGGNLLYVGEANAPSASPVAPTGEEEGTTRRQGTRWSERRAARRYASRQAPWRRAS
eukprot:2228426-Prymnesium_polylepis.1